MNLTLSADCPKVARKMVMDNGIDGGQVAAESYGREHPIATMIRLKAAPRTGGLMCA